MVGPFLDEYLYDLFCSSGLSDIFTIYIYIQILAFGKPKLSMFSK